MISAGVDIGSVASKAVFFDHIKNKIIAYSIIPTGWNHSDAFANSLNTALNFLDKDEIYFKKAQSKKIPIGVTGYGRITAKEKAKVFSEISCHAKGAHYLCPDATGVVDIGGQDSKAIKLGPSGIVQDFIMNDKCAAGTGRFIQMVATLLELNLEEFDKAASSASPSEISSMCAVFAESEIISLLARGEKPESIAAGVALSVASRTAGLAARLSFTGPFTFTGGLASTESIAKHLERSMALPLLKSPKAQIAGALGAALLIN